MSLDTKLLINGNPAPASLPASKQGSDAGLVAQFLGELFNPSFKSAICALTAICGVMDAVSFIGLGGVFTNIQTGNIVQLAFLAGYSTSERLIDSSDRIGGLFVSLLSFIVGAFIGGLCTTGALSKVQCRFFKEKRIGFLIEWLFLLGAVICAAIYDSRQLTVSNNVLVIEYQRELWLCIAFTAASMGLQAALVRSFGLLDFATNLMTLTLVALVAESKPAGGKGLRWHRRLGSILLFSSFACVGAAVSLKGRGPIWPLVLDLALLTYVLRALLLGTPPPPPAPAPAAPAAPAPPAAVPKP
jgi:uncharacterized membrane protein YoaK (UPF0700 family)